jgi:hypothetical protein
VSQAAAVAAGSAAASSFSMTLTSAVATPRRQAQRAPKVVAADSGRRTASPCSVGRTAKRIAVQRVARPTIATKSTMMIPSVMCTSQARAVMGKDAKAGPA